MALDTNATKLAELINPEIMADMISGKVEKKIKVMPYAKLDTTLQGQAGNEITVPKFTYIGDAVDVAEGEDIPIRKMGTSSESYKIKKAAIGGQLTDEAVLSGYGNPVGEFNTQMGKSIAAKCDTDAMEELYKASTSYTANGIISYNSTVNAIDLFEEEENSEKVEFIHPKQTTQLRLDANFISKEKYGNQVMVDGEIGIIGNARIVPSKRVKLVKYELDNTNGTITIVADSTAESATALHLATAQKNALGELKIGDKLKTVTNYYANPIVKLETEEETEDESPAITVFLKRDTNVETERKARNRSTEVTGDKMYVVALTNDTKVVIAKNLATAQSV